ncbi:MAG: succinylglutamate desuccinylase/aspartoacylase family protein [Lachnospiraceae bacterium]|nr:succinylglutamate desuccinylase/aspartoacylase family protein [Lachnospiraceae bacterium]
MEGIKIQEFISVEGTEVVYPQTLILGDYPGKTVTVSAGVHSREYVGMEAVMRLAAMLKPEQICGKLRLIHAVNYNGLIRRSSDVCPEDGMNLNRAFPGDAMGSSTKRLAMHLEREVISDSDAIIDLHSGGFCEALTPHVYFHGVCEPQVNKVSEEIANHVNVPYIVRSTAKNGFYSHAGQCGVPAIILERGGSGLWTEEEVLADMEDVLNILRFLGVLRDGVPAVRRNPKVLPGGFYEDAPVSGLWYPNKKVGDFVSKGEELGQIKDAFGHTVYSYVAKGDGVLLYQTISLGIEKDRPMVAYGLTSA